MCKNACLFWGRFALKQHEMGVSKLHPSPAPFTPFPTMLAILTADRIRFLTPVVAVGAIDLANKLPWSQTYEPVASMTISNMDIMEVAGAPVFSDMFNLGEGTEEDFKSNVSRVSDVFHKPPARDSPPNTSFGPSLLFIAVPPGVNADVDKGIHPANISGAGTDVAAPSSAVSARGGGGDDGPYSYGTFAGEGNKGAGGAMGFVLDRGEDAAESSPATHVGNLLAIEGTTTAKESHSEAITRVPSLRVRGGDRGELGESRNIDSTGGDSGASGVKELVLNSAIEEEVGTPSATLEVKMIDAIGQEDEGVGVFGAMLHEPGESGSGGLGAGEVFYRWSLQLIRCPCFIPLEILPDWKQRGMLILSLG